MAYGFTKTLPTISGSHSDFVVVFKTADFPTAAIDGGGSSILNGGGNLRAYTDSSKTTQLPVYISKFVASVGATIYIEADAIETTQPAVTDSYGRNAVFVSVYEAYLELKESTGPWVDLTGNGYDATLTTGAISAVAGGPLGDWLEFTGTQVLTLDGSAAALNNSAMTIRAWVSINQSSWAIGVFGNRYSIPDDNWISIQANQRGFVKSGAEDFFDDGGRTTYQDHLVHLTHDATSMVLYEDGSALGSDTTISATSGIQSTLDYRVGTYFADTSASRYRGRIGAIGLIRSKLSADWIATEYSNQSATVTWGCKIVTGKHVPTR